MRSESSVSIRLRYAFSAAGGNRFSVAARATSRVNAADAYVESTGVAAASCTQRTRLSIASGCGRTTYEPAAVKVSTESLAAVHWSSARSRSFRRRSRSTSQILCARDAIGPRVERGILQLVRQRFDASLERLNLELQVADLLLRRAQRAACVACLAPRLLAPRRLLLFLNAPERFVLGRDDRRRVLSFSRDRFPLAKVSVEVGDVLFVKHPNPCRERAQQFAIVAHEQHAAFVLIDGILERFDRLDVEMVRRLVENQQIRAAEHQHRERDSRALAAGERVGASLHFVAGKSKAAEVSLNHPAIPRWPQIVDDVVQRLVERHLRHVLAVVAGRDPAADAKLARR